MPEAAEIKRKRCSNCQVRRGGAVLVDAERRCLECGAVVPEKPPYPQFDDLGPHVPPFEDYFKRHEATIRDTQAIMARALADDPVTMESQVREAEARLGTLKSILGWADSYLDVAEHQALGGMPPRSQDWTDMDREKAVSAAVTRQRRFRDVIRGLVDSIEVRISYAQSRLRFIERNNG